MSHPSLLYAALSCGSAPSVSHATLSYSYVNSLRIATYTCDAANGYVSRGNNTIACLQLHGYSVWTSVQVTCQSKPNPKGFHSYKHENCIWGAAVIILSLSYLFVLKYSDLPNFFSYFAYLKIIICVSLASLEYDSLWS